MEIEKHSPKWLLNEIRNAESDAHALFKIIEFQKALTEQCNIADVVVPKGTLVCEHPEGKVDEIKRGVYLCECGKWFKKAN